VAEAEEASAAELEPVPAEEITPDSPTEEITKVTEPSEVAFYRVNANWSLFKDSSFSIVRSTAIFNEN
jgi:hypothetical protein